MPIENRPRQREGHLLCPEVGSRAGDKPEYLCILRRFQAGCYGEEDTRLDRHDVR